MNLDNVSLPEVRHLIAVIAEAGEISPERAAKIVAAMHRDGFGVAYAPCAGCRAVHEMYPRVQAYHSPVCTQQGRCAMCGGSIEPMVKPGHEVGLICQECYGETA